MKNQQKGIKSPVSRRRTRRSSGPAHALCSSGGGNATTTRRLDGDTGNATNGRLAALNWPTCRPPDVRMVPARQRRPRNVSRRSTSPKRPSRVTSGKTTGFASLLITFSDLAEFWRKQLSSGTSRIYAVFQLGANGHNVWFGWRDQTQRAIRNTSKQTVFYYSTGSGRTADFRTSRGPGDARRSVTGDAAMQVALRAVPREFKARSHLASRHAHTGTDHIPQTSMHMHITHSPPFTKKTKNVILWLFPSLSSSDK